MEHLVDPVGALLEARRVARRAVVFSTEEFATSEELRRHFLAARSFEGHGERNIFVREDFELVFEGWHLEVGQQRDPGDPDGFELTAESVRSWLLGRLDSVPLGIIGAASPTEIPSSARVENGDAPRRLADLMLAGVVDGASGAPLTAPYMDRLADSAEVRQVIVSGGIPVNDAYVHRPPARSVEAACRRLGMSLSTSSRLQSLAALFDMKPEREVKDWSAFDLSSSATGWETVDCRWIGEGLLDARGDDPQLVSPYLILPTAEVGSILIEIELPEAMDRDCLEVYFQLDGDVGFAYQQRVPQVYTRQQGMAGLVVDLEGLRELGEHLVRLRIDPILTIPPGPVGIRRIALHASTN